MIPFLFFLCFVVPSGYDCSYSIEFMPVEQINAEQNPGNHWVGAIWNPNTKTIYIDDLRHFPHEYRHAFCYNDWIYYDKVHNYCVAPHFKVIGV